LPPWAVAPRCGPRTHTAGRAIVALTFFFLVAVELTGAAPAPEERKLFFRSVRPISSDRSFVPTRPTPKDVRNRTRISYEENAEPRVIREARAGTSEVHRRTAGDCRVRGPRAARHALSHDAERAVRRPVRQASWRAARELNAPASPDSSWEVSVPESSAPARARPVEIDEAAPDSALAIPATIVKTTSSELHRRPSRPARLSAPDLRASTKDWCSAYEPFTRWSRRGSGTLPARAPRGGKTP